MRRNPSYFPAPRETAKLPVARRDAPPDLGDVLILRGKPWTSRVVTTLTLGKYSHCAVVVTGGAVVDVDPRAGVRHTSIDVFLEQYPGEAHLFAVRPELRHLLDPRALAEEALAHVGRPFAWRSVVHAGAHAWLGLPPPRERSVPPAYFCSQLVSRCFRKAGSPLSAVTDIMASPSLLASSTSLFRVRILAESAPVASASSRARG